MYRILVKSNNVTHRVLLISWDLVQNHAHFRGLGVFQKESTPPCWLGTFNKTVWISYYSANMQINDLNTHPTL